MNRINIPLILGAILLIALLVIALFPQMLTDRNPYSMSLIHTWVDDEGELQILAPPYEPSERYVLGSDKVGRDIWSLVVNGTRLTLTLALTVTLLRFMLAVPMGIAGAMGKTGAKTIIDQFNIVLTTIPPLLVGILILKMEFFTSLYKMQSAAVFVLTLMLIGWARTGNLMYESASRIMEETYILSEKAIGKTKWRIAIRNVLPHMLPEIIVTFFMEIARVLTLMMQLGIFGVFVGNVRLINDSSNFGYSYIKLPYEPEWSGLMGAAKEYIRSAPWIVFTAAAFFVTSVLAFNLFGEGLRIELQKKHSRLTEAFARLSALRRSSTLESKLTLGALALTFVVVFGTVSYSQIRSEVEWLPVDDYGYNYDQIVPGSQESEAVSEIIAEAMAEMGLAPLSEEGYRQVFDGADKWLFDDSTIMLSAGPYAQMLRPGVDFEIPLGYPVETTLEILDMTEHFFDYAGMDLSGKLLYVDSDSISDEAILESIAIFAERGAAGVVTTRPETELCITEDRPYLYLVVDNSFRDYFSEPDARVTLELSSRAYDRDNANVLGIIEGQDPVIRDKGVIVAVDYAFLEGTDHYTLLNQYLGLMRTVKAHEEELNRSIVFAFFADRDEAVEYYANHQLFPTKNILVFHDMMGLDNLTSDGIRFSDDLSPVSRYYGFTLSSQLQSDMAAYLSEEPVELTVRNSYLYRKKGYTTLIYESEEGTGLMLEDFLSRFARLLISNAK